MKWRGPQGACETPVWLLSSRNLKIISLHWLAAMQKFTKIPLGHRALLGVKSTDSSAETKAFVPVTALPRPPVETSDGFMTDRSAGGGQWHAHKLHKRAHMHTALACAALIVNHGHHAWNCLKYWRQVFIEMMPNMKHTHIHPRPHAHTHTGLYLYLCEDLHWHPFIVHSFVQPNQPTLTLTLTTVLSNPNLNLTPITKHGNL